jgi:hypothetical protein
MPLEGETPAPPDVKPPDAPPPGPKAPDPKGPDVDAKGPESKAPDPAKPADTKMTRAEQIEELAKDPDNGYKPVPKTRREAEVALDLVDQGKLPGPVRRPVKGDGHSGDFVDGNGKDWDVKAPRSREKLIEDITAENAKKGRKPPNFRPDKKIDGEFDLAKELKSIEDQVKGGEGVIVDTAKLNPADLAALKDAVTKAGLDGKVIYHE